MASSDTKKTKQRIYHKCLSLLARREHSQMELQQKLAAFDTQLVEQVLLDLQQNNLQSNQRFAESLVKSRFNQGKGLLRIQWELNQHQLDPQDIQQALDNYQPKDWQQLCYQVWLKKFAKPAEDYHQQQKHYRFLSARGFSREDWQAFLK